MAQEAVNMWFSAGLLCSLLDSDLALTITPKRLQLVIYSANISTLHCIYSSEKGGVTASISAVSSVSRLSIP